MDQWALEWQTQCENSADLISILLHLDDPDPDAASRVALATRGDDGWDELTYRQLGRRSGQMRDWLTGHGVGVGDRVALWGESGNDWVAAFFGILRRGAIAVPLDTGLTAAELAQIWIRSAPMALVVSSGLCDPAHAMLAHLEVAPPVLLLDSIDTIDAIGDSAGYRQLPAVDATRSMDEPALVVWTSGTTGTAKGVSLSFANLDHVVTHSAAGQGLDRDDHWLSILPLHHMFALSCGLLVALRSGATVCFGRSLMPREVVESMRQRSVTRMVVVPLVLRLLHDELLRQPAIAGRLGALWCGGAPLGLDLIEGYGEMGIPVYQGYGLTELGPTVSMNSARHNRPGSVGRPIEGTELRILEGEIVVRSPGLMTGYWRDDQLTRTVVDGDGWFHTGDLGEVDADGYLYVTGRTKNLIVLDSGKKVQPEEVEAVLGRSRLFAEVCVVAVRPPTGRLASSEQVCAVVVPTGDVRAHYSGTELRATMAAEVDRRSMVLSGYKRPSVVEVWHEELPKTAKRSLRRAEVTRLVRRRQAGS